MLITCFHGKFELPIYFYTVTLITLLSMTQFTSSQISQKCSFAKRWRGEWMQTTFSNNITITASEIKDKGVCWTQSGNKYLLYNRNQNCYQCLYITEKHYNVLQYKESFCSSKDTLENICSKITGDAFLFTLFRKNPSEINCPFNSKSYSFVYESDQGKCNSSSLRFESCLNPSKYEFNFAKCDVTPSPKQTKFSLTCLAVWNDGENKILAGKVDIRESLSKEIAYGATNNQYRCFIIKQLAQDEIELSMSFDSTCFGIFSTNVGMHVFRLKDRFAMLSRHTSCYFPRHLANKDKWKMLDHSHFVRLDSGRENGGKVLHKYNSRSQEVESETCVHQIPQNLINDSTYLEFVVYAVSNCKHGFKCLRIHRRSNHIIELQETTLSNSIEGVCGENSFTPHSSNFKTFYSEEVFNDMSECPMKGVHKIASRIPNKHCFDRVSFIEMSCRRSDTMHITHTCTQRIEMHTKSKFRCHAYWKEDDVMYLITSEHKTQEINCFGIKESKNSVTFISNFLQNCNRFFSPGIDGIMRYEAVKIGQCQDVHSSSSSAFKLGKLKFASLLTNPTFSLMPPLQMLFVILFYFLNFV